MTVKDEFNKFTHEVEEVLHEVEEALHDVKEHMILSVRDYSIQIAFVLMGITSAILVIGTVYVWCFHHPKPPRNPEESDSHKQTSEQPSENPSLKQSNLPIQKRSANSPSKKKRTADNEVKADDSYREVLEEVAQTKEEDVVSDQNGLRQRTTTANANNNNCSPVKSKIPVRQKSRNSSSS